MRRQPAHARPQPLSPTHTRATAAPRRPVAVAGAKNLAPEKASRSAKGSKTAEAVTSIQRRLPNARVLYVSATAAAETRDLGYMSRLGLWGGPSGAAFPDFHTFASTISKAGVGAMELVAMDMKA